MSDSPVLVSTRSNSTAVVHTPASAELDVEFAKAKAIAAAGELLPPAYRNKPGAIVLVSQWAKARDIDIVTAIQTVAFVHGKPVVDATMQRALAERAGYRVKVLDDECNATSARVEISKDGEVLGASTYTIEDAKVAGIAGKDNWRKNPADMLVARATTRAIRRHAPSVMLGTFTEEEVESFDPVAVLTEDVAGGESGAVPSEEAADTGPPPATDVVDAEVVEDAPALATGTPLTMESLKGWLREAGMTQRQLIDTAAIFAERLSVKVPRSLQDVIDTPELTPDICATLAAEVAKREQDEDPF